MSKDHSVTDIILPNAKKPVVLVTGGSEGIGFCFADEFAALGSHVVLLARNRNKLEQAVADLSKRHSVTIECLPLDLTEQDSVQKISDWMSERNYYIDILVNNAGMGYAGSFISHGTDQISRMLALNLKICTDLILAVLPQMIERQKGGVLNVASLAGLGPFPYFSVYTATKAYMINLSCSLFEEVRGSGVRMCVVAPGPVNTAFHVNINDPVPGMLKKVLFIQPQAVAHAGVNGFLRGKRLVVPGLLAMLAQLGLKLLPHRVIGFVMGLIIRMFSK